ncbi:hypothetical protein SOASR029_08230 [Budvicia aquatica]|nr:hypothetical protein SOASR029_08230 [Budvicia aquatica]
MVYHSNRLLEIAIVCLTFLRLKFHPCFIEDKQQVDTARKLDGLKGDFMAEKFLRLTINNATVGNRYSDFI